MHALALARRGIAVELCGYGDSPVYEDLKKQKLISTTFLSSPTRTPKQARRNLAFVFIGLLRALRQNRSDRETGVKRRTAANYPGTKPTGNTDSGRRLAGRIAAPPAVVYRLA